MARRDGDGFYYIVGRKKRFIKLYGNRVGLDEVERLLAARFPDTGFAAWGGMTSSGSFTTARSRRDRGGGGVSQRTDALPGAGLSDPGLGGHSQE